jgi:hypothetical protein
MQLGDLFSGYAQQMKATRNAQLKGDFTKAETSVPLVNPGHNNYALTQLEKGRLTFLANNWSNSQKNFETAYKQVQAQDEAAKIQISKGIEKVSAVVSNDNAIAYEIPRYEQGMLHTYQALNYLYQDSLEGAMVEIRRANLVQERALKENQDELYEAQKEMANKGVSPERLNAAYPSMNAMIGDLKNGFQNAYTFYLSGVMYEASNKPNDAYIDYKRALEIFPENKYLQQDVLRLATSLDMSDDLIQFEKRFGEYKVQVNNKGQVIIILEQGIVNAKEEAKINLPIFNTSSSSNLKFFTFALPVFRGSLAPLSTLSVSIGEDNYQSEPIVRLQSLASKNLQDNLAGLVTRQVVRVIAKEQMRQQASKSGGDIGNILASLYNIASEKADTRSWSTLPDRVDILRMNLPAGKQQISLSIAGQAIPVDIDVKPDGITLINLTSIGRYTGYQSINL